MGRLALILVSILFGLHLLGFKGYLCMLLLVLARLLVGVSLLLWRVLLLRLLLLKLLIYLWCLIRLLGSPCVCCCVYLARLQLLEFFWSGRFRNWLECLVVILWEECDVAHLKCTRFLSWSAIAGGVGPTKTRQVLVRSRWEGRFRRWTGHFLVALLLLLLLKRINMFHMARYVYLLTLNVVEGVSSGTVATFALVQLWGSVLLRWVMVNGCFQLFGRAMTVLFRVLLPAAQRRSLTRQAFRIWNRHIVRVRVATLCAGRRFLEMKIVHTRAYYWLLKSRDYSRFIIFQKIV